MVDILSTRVHEVYTNWDKPDPVLDTKLSLSSLKRRGAQHQKDRMKLLHFENLQRTRERQLFNIKESPWLGYPSPVVRPVVGMSCGACTPNSKDSLVSEAAKNLSIKNVLHTDAETSPSFWTRRFCHLVTNYKLKKYSYPQVAKTVMSDERMQTAIETTVQEAYDEMKDEEKSEELYKQIWTTQEARARRILLTMRSTLSDFLLRITSWLLYKLLPRFLTSVCLHPAQLEMLQKAAKTNLPLIFIPLHRSHLDYILISFILLNNNIKCPLVAAGNNLRIPVFGWLLRGLGAFFIKRRIDPVSGRKDVLYRAVLHTYMMQCLKAGHNIEFYIEGGRTRTGKPCMPKGGLLSVIVDAYLDGTVDDALLVPVSVNYEKLVDGNFIREQLGQPKQMETFSNAAAGIWSVLNSNYGLMRIDFNQPFSLKELVRSFQTMNKTRMSDCEINLGGDANDANLNTLSSRNGMVITKHLHSTPSSTSLYGTDVVAEDQRNLVDSIARHIIYDSSRACAVMSTNAVAFLLLNRFRDGVRIDKLVECLDKLRQDLSSSQKDVAYTGDSLDVIHHAVRLLGPDLIKKEIPKDSDDKIEVITPVTSLPNVIALSYYNNGLLPHFALEGVVATSICSYLKLNPSDESVLCRTNSFVNQINEDVIITNCIEICNILQYEFIFTKPCNCLETILAQTLDTFKIKEILVQKQKLLNEAEEWSVRYAKTFEDEMEEEDDEDIRYRNVPEYNVNTSRESMKELEFYHTTLRSFIDVYTVTSLSLRRLVGRQVTENEFVQEVLTDVRSHLDTGYCSYGESCSVDPIKNALKLFEKWGILEVYNQEKVKLIYLSEVYDNETNLEQVYDRFKIFKCLSTVKLK